MTDFHDSYTYVWKYKYSGKLGPKAFLNEKHIWPKAADVVKGSISRLTPISSTLVAFVPMWMVYGLVFETESPIPPIHV